MRQYAFQYYYNTIIGWAEQSVCYTIQDRKYPFELNRGEGAEIQCLKNIFSNPTSNKIVREKNKSVAELSVLFNSPEGGSWGVEKHAKGVQEKRKYAQQ